MKKSIKIFMATLVALTLAACSNENNKKSSSSETKTTQKSSVSKKVEKSEQSDESSSSSESSSSEVSSSSQSGPQQAKVTGDNNTQRMAQIAGALKYFLGKDALVPTKAGINSGIVNAYYTGDGNNFSVYYIKDTEGKNFNDPSLKDKVSYITFSKKTYGSEEEAEQAVNYISGESEMGLPKVPLSGNVNATLNSGAGQRYLHWNSGKWSVTIHGTAGKDPVPTGRKVVALLNNAYLPAPDSRGAASFTAGSGSGNQKIEWNSGKAVYTIKGSNINSLIELAGSIQK
ncbi:hypothetical protein [Ligilactobacillus salivarius]|uniref:hypothetical protein n=1 Tax=Ligilactobacillus salivarius TaxID=1624 RepID=UPI0020235379|nr:hypothetical protein [Ligilactobacillus salivarius]URI12741.1 hypothetical protein M9Y03_07485 [Ligilactobacillus salivarius]UUB34569.1 hypothetical protein NO469_07475 [Ligilactobacillus salivarius]